MSDEASFRNGAGRGAPGARSGFAAGQLAVRSLVKRRGWAIVVLLAVAFAWDRAVYLNVAVGARLGDPELMRVRVKETLEASGLYSLLKFCGEMYIPMLIGIFLILRDWAHFAGRNDQRAKGPKGQMGEHDHWHVHSSTLFRRAAMVFLVPGLAGLIAEVIKGLTRRERPLVAVDERGFGGWMSFRWWWDGPFDWENLSFVSSHAAVAFGWAFALCAIWPRLSGMWIFVAILCAFTRVLSGAHFLSDVLGGMIVAYGAFVFLYEWDRWNNGGVGIEDHLINNEDPEIEGIGAGGAGRTQRNAA